MMRWEWRCFLTVMAALLIPTGLFYLLRGEARQLSDLTAAPFAWPTLLLAHLVCALPLGFQLARMIQHQPEYRPWPALVGIAIGMTCALLVAWIGSMLSESLTDLEIGTFVPLLVRSFLALLLVLPWCIACGSAPMIRRGNDFGVVGLIVLLVPTAWYGDYLLTARTEQATDFLHRERLVAAQRDLMGLCEMGSARPIAGLSPRAQLKRLDETIARLHKQVERNSGSGIDRAILLIRVERLSEAAALLEPLAGKNLNALLLLATVRRDQERWREAAEWYQQAWEKLAPSETSEPSIRQASRTALEGVIYCGQRDRNPAIVEQMLHMGRSAEVLDEAEFAFLLGQHFADAGQPARALERLQEAARIAPDRYGEIASQRIRQLQMQTPICVLNGTMQPK